MEQHLEKNGVILWDFPFHILGSDPQTKLHAPFDMLLKYHVLLFSNQRINGKFLCIKDF